MLCYGGPDYNDYSELEEQRNLSGLEKHYNKIKAYLCCVLDYIDGVDGSFDDISEFYGPNIRNVFGFDISELRKWHIEHKKQDAERITKSIRSKLTVEELEFLKGNKL